MKKGFTETILNKKFRDYSKIEKIATIELAIVGCSGFILMVLGTVVRSTSYSVIGFGLLAASLILFFIILQFDKNNPEGEDEEERFERCLSALERIVGFRHEDMDAACEWYGIYEEDDKTVYEMAVQSDLHRYRKLGVVNDNVLFDIMTKEDQAKVREIVNLSGRSEELNQDLANDKCHCRIINSEHAEGCVILEDLEHRLIFIGIDKMGV